MSYLSQTDPEIADIIEKERLRQTNGLELIASENIVSRAVLEAMGSIMTNKYAEGYPGKRYYGGCEFHDMAENLARDRLKKLFGAEHANVQPHSGTQANMAVYFAYMKLGEKILSMKLNQGGHLSHGRRSVSPASSIRSPSMALTPKRKRSITVPSARWQRRRNRRSSYAVHPLIPEPSTLRHSRRSPMMSVPTVWQISPTSPGWSLPASTRHRSV